MSGNSLLYNNKLILKIKSKSKYEKFGRFYVIKNNISQHDRARYIFVKFQSKHKVCFSHWLLRYLARCALLWWRGMYHSWKHGSLLHELTSGPSWTTPAALDHWEDLVTVLIAIRNRSANTHHSLLLQSQPRLLWTWSLLIH